VLRAYRRIYTDYTYAPPQLWEAAQPYIDNLSRSAPAFGHRMKQQFFLNEEALNQENNRIWRTHCKPKPAHDHIASWQTYLEWYRQVVAKVLKIAVEKEWRGPGCAMVSD
jgi:hypothetical protein